MAIWVDNAITSRRMVSGPTIHAQACEFAQQMEIKEDKLKFSNGWLNSFKDHIKLHAVTWHGEAASVSAKAVALAQAEAQNKIVGYALCDIYNMDEMGLFYRMSPDHTSGSPG